MIMEQETEARSQKPGVRSQEPEGKQTKLFVRWRGYALMFHTNACGPMYSAVGDDDATRFDTKEEAWARAQKHGLKLADIVIEPIAVAP